MAIIKQDYGEIGGGDSYPLACYIHNYSSYYSTSAPQGTLIWTLQKSGAAANEWLTQSSSGWIKYKLDSNEAKKVKKVRFMNLVQNASQTSRSVAIYGSNDDSTYTPLGTFTPDASQGSINEFNLSNNTNYLYYRVDVTGVSSFVGFGAIQFYE